MTADLKLLTAAAHAGGITVERNRLDDPIFRDMLVRNSARSPGQKIGPWNPLTDDGDAMRLAAAIGAWLYLGDINVSVDVRGIQFSAQARPGQNLAAARRLITQAAAYLAGVKP